jgi:hypothetical protein
MVLEDPEEAVKPNIHTRRLDHGLVVRLELDTFGGDLGADVAVAEQHPADTTERATPQVVARDPMQPAR